MRITKKYFSGKSGVYYDPKQDRLWWLEQGKTAYWFNMDRRVSYRANRYFVYTEGVNGELLAINVRLPFIWIGDL